MKYKTVPVGEGKFTVMKKKKSKWKHIYIKDINSGHGGDEIHPMVGTKEDCEKVVGVLNRLNIVLINNPIHWRIVSDFCRRIRVEYVYMDQSKVKYVKRLANKVHDKTENVVDNPKTRELLQIEFRYYDAPKGEHDSDWKSNTVTIGVYDTFDEACIAGNKLLENLESKFELHTFPSGEKAKKDRFSKNGGCFGSKKKLVTNLEYLRTPFQFFAKITTLKYDSVDDTIEEVLKGIERYKEFRKNDDYGE